MLSERLTQYANLMRLNKPIGPLLLLWPTLWALWLASHGLPDGKILTIFILGAILMNLAGRILNDIADKRIDGHVERTRERPLATGKVSLVEAFTITGLLLFAAFLLVLQCNALTIALAFVGVGLAAGYPFLKRITHLPQVGLGVAYQWSIPMAFAAVNDVIATSAWFVFLGSILWPVIYDTLYAMVDREDDIKIGVKSSAILFADADKLIIGLLQIIFMIFLIMIGFTFQLHAIYYASLTLVGLLFAYQQWLIRHRDRQQCFKAFLNNNWVGMIIFAGIALSYLQ